MNNPEEKKERKEDKNFLRKKLRLQSYVRLQIHYSALTTVSILPHALECFHRLIETLKSKSQFRGKQTGDINHINCLVQKFLIF